MHDMLVGKAWEVAKRFFLLSFFVAHASVHRSGFRWIGYLIPLFSGSTAFSGFGSFMENLAGLQPCNAFVFTGYLPDGVCTVVFRRS